MLDNGPLNDNGSKNSEFLRTVTTLICCIIMVTLLVKGIVDHNIQDVVLITPGFMTLSTAWINRKEK